MKKTSGDSKIISMVASLIPEDTTEKGFAKAEEKFSYRIVHGPPIGRSFAEHIAQQHGIGFPQLVDLLTERGVLES